MLERKHGLFLTFLKWQVLLWYCLVGSVDV